MNLLRRLLPVPLRDDPLLSDITEALFAPFGQWMTWLDTRTRFVLIENLPDDWLDFVLHVSGWPPMRSRTADQKRAVLRLGVLWWLRSGTKEATIAYLQALTDVSANIETTDDQALYPSPTLYPSPELYPSDGLQTWLFVVEVPFGSIEEEELRRLLRPVVPAFSKYTVRYI